MNLPVIQRILGLLIMVFSVTMLPPLLVGLLYGESSWLAFAESFLFIILLGGLIWWPVRKRHEELRLRDGFIVVASFWVGLGLVGAAPLYLVATPDLSLTDAVFESMSGLTTTGATVIQGLDELPKAILYYRQQLQWFGGMGIIVLAVAVLPMLGVGGMQLYRAETPGPVKDSKLTPRITETAKALWYIYLGITVFCGVAFWSAGMTVFDAISHSFSTVAIGGFSTHDASIAYFESAKIEWITIFFMLLAGVNFSLHFVAWREGRITAYLQDPEFRFYLVVLLTASTLICLALMSAGTFMDWPDGITKSVFQAVSIGTTTGFATADFSAWPGAVPLLLILLSFIGGCAGSTGGGMKVVRWLLIYKQGARELFRLVHPNAETPVKLGSKAVPDRVIEAVWGFFSVYVVIFGFMMLILMTTGLDQVTAFSAVAATLNNLGPGLGEVASSFSSVNDVAKWVAVVGMLLGRLEIFTLLVLCTPAFWRR